MVCIYCGSDTQVTNSRPQRRNNQVWRRRQCLKCRAVFTTHEAVDLSASLFIEKGGRKLPFLNDLLYTEVLLAMQDRKDAYTAAREITASVIVRLLKSKGSEALINPKQISKTTAIVLKRFDRRAWLRYVAEHPSLQA